MTVIYTVPLPEVPSGCNGTISIVHLSQTKCCPYGMLCSSAVSTTTILLHMSLELILKETFLVVFNQSLMCLQGSLIMPPIGEFIILSVF